MLFVVPEIGAWVETKRNKQDVYSSRCLMSKATAHHG